MGSTSIKFKFRYPNETTEPVKVISFTKDQKKYCVFRQTAFNSVFTVLGKNYDKIYATLCNTAIIAAENNSYIHTVITTGGYPYLRFPYVNANTSFVSVSNDNIDYYNKEYKQVLTLQQDDITGYYIYNKQTYKQTYYDDNKKLYYDGNLANDDVYSCDSASEGKADCATDTIKQTGATTYFFQNGNPITAEYFIFQEKLYNKNGGAYETANGVYSCDSKDEGQEDCATDTIKQKGDKTHFFQNGQQIRAVYFIFTNQGTKTLYKRNNNHYSAVTDVHSCNSADEGQAKCSKTEHEKNNIFFGGQDKNGQINADNTVTFDGKEYKQKTFTAEVKPIDIIIKSAISREYTQPAIFLYNVTPKDAHIDKIKVDSHNTEVFNELPTITTSGVLTGEITCLPNCPDKITLNITLSADDYQDLKKQVKIKITQGIGQHYIADESSIKTLYEKEKANTYIPVGKVHSCASQNEGKASCSDSEIKGINGDNSKTYFFGGQGKNGQINADDTVTFYDKTYNKKSDNTYGLQAEPEQDPQGIKGPQGEQGSENNFISQLLTEGSGTVSILSPKAILTMMSLYRKLADSEKFDRLCQFIDSVAAPNNPYNLDTSIHKEITSKDYCERGVGTLWSAAPYAVSDKGREEIKNN